MDDENSQTLVLVEWEAVGERVAEDVVGTEVVAGSTGASSVGWKELSGEPLAEQDAVAAGCADSMKGKPGVVGVVDDMPEADRGGLVVAVAASAEAVQTGPGGVAGFADTPVDSAVGTAVAAAAAVVVDAVAAGGGADH